MILYIFQAQTAQSRSLFEPDSVQIHLVSLSYSVSFASARAFLFSSSRSNSSLTRQSRVLSIVCVKRLSTGY
jgi:hypothetical protein